MKYKKLLGVILSLFICQLCSGADLIKNGKACSEIIVAENASPATRLAAKELQKYLKAITGAELPILPPDAGKAKVKLCVGESKVTRAANYKMPLFRRSGYEIYVKGDLVILAGPVFPAPRRKTSGKLTSYTGLSALASDGDPANGFLQEDNGNFYGVTAFLELLGVRFYAPGKDGTYIPKRKTIALPDMRKKSEAAYAGRLFLLPPGSKLDQDSLLWLKHLKSGSSQALPLLFPLTEITKKILSSNPSWAAKDKKGRILYTDEGFPCPRITDPGFQKACIEYIRKEFDQNPSCNEMQILFPKFRNGNLDAGDLQKWMKHERDWGAINTMFLSFYQALADGIRSSHPGKHLLCTLGNNNLPAEETWKDFPENLLLIPSPAGVVSYGNRNSLTGHAERLAKRGELLKGKSFPLKELWNEFDHPEVPRQFFYFMGALQERRKAEKAFISRVVMQPSLSCRKDALGELAISHLMYYVNSRLLWEPELDLDSLLAEYCRYSFGPAAEKMKYFFQYGEYVTSNPGNRKIHATRGQLRKRDLEVMKELLANAKKRVPKDSLYGKRIASLEKKTASLEKVFADRIPRGSLVKGNVLHYETPCNGDMAKYRYWYPLYSKGKKAHPATYVSYAFSEDRRRIFVAFRCYEKEMSKLKGTKFLPDSKKIFREDHVRLDLESPDSLGHTVILNSAGAILDGAADPEWIRRNGSYLAWQPYLQRSIRHFSDRWEAELCLTLDGFGKGPDYAPNWGIRLSRQRMISGKKELFTLSADPALRHKMEIPKADSKGNFLTFHYQKMLPLPGSREESTYIVKRAKGKVDISAPWDSREWKDIPAITMNWNMEKFPVHDFRPDVQIKLQYDAKNLYVLYQVKDQYVKGDLKNDQEMVCIDSCVELFIRPDARGPYYNFESNCIGTILLYECTPRGNRNFMTPMPQSALQKIKRFSTLPRDMKGEIREKITWRLGLEIPFSLFAERLKKDLPVKGQIWTGNFYKCADYTSHPTWLTWKKCSAFHAPDEFGTFIFE